MIRLFVTVLCLVLCMPHHAGAQVSDSFLINAFIGNDAEAPSTPANLAAVAISFDQIDLTWDAASDNVGVAGYQIFRDSLQIATTTATIYSDGGLSASTSYDYVVRAFDAAGNLSSSSATATAITLALPATSTPPEQAGGSESTRTDALVAITNLSIVPSQNGLLITFTTDEPARTAVRWGQGSVLEGGYSLQDTLQTNHRLQIDGLEPGTVYTISLALTDRFNRLGQTIERTATTLPAPDTTPPQNVMDFQAVGTDSGVALSWTNPPDPDFDRVRIVRSERFYPTDLVDGMVVYEGAGDRHLDTRLRAEVPVYYYTAFALDAEGNRSSGAITFAVRGVVPPDSEDDVPVPPVSLGRELPVQFVQVDGTQLITESAQLQLWGDEPTTVRIPYEALPENLKTIMVTITDRDTAAVFSFLLRVNRDKTAYEATFGALPGGMYDIAVTLFDYELQQVVRGENTLFVTGAGVGQEKTTALSYAYARFWFFILLPVLLLALLWRWRHRSA